MSDDPKVVDIVTNRPYSPRTPTAEEVVKTAEDYIVWCDSCNLSDFKIIGYSLYCSSCLHKMKGLKVLYSKSFGLAPPEDGVHEDD